MKAIKRLLGLFNDNRRQQPGREPYHYQCLQQCQLQQLALDITVTENQLEFEADVVDIDYDYGELLVGLRDNHNPASNLREGQTVQVRTQSQQYPLNFYSRIIAIKEHNQLAALRLDLPENVVGNYGRDAFRIYVENIDDLRFNIELDQLESPYHVGIINLSTEGVKLRFSADISHAICIEKRYSDCQIVLPNKDIIHCHWQPSNLQIIARPQLHSFAGGSITIDNPQQRTRLAQFLAKVQRAQQRRHKQLN